MKTGSSDVAVYSPREEALPAFDLTGVTKIVTSGGELYGEVRADGRWEMLRELGGDGNAIYGVASLDSECPAGHYRYTLAVKGPVADVAALSLKESLFTIHIPESEWVVFTLENFAGQYGGLWQDDPYKLVKQLVYCT